MTETRADSIPLEEGVQLRLTVAEPEHAIRGGIVVIHEARGVTGAVRRVISGLAAEGWLVVAPHLYHREDTDHLLTEPIEQVIDQVRRLTAEEVMTDADAALRWLTQHGVAADRIGIIGFGLGGSVALLVAADRQLGAAVSVSAVGVLSPLSESLPTLVDAAPRLRCPWLGLYAGDDPVPAADVEKLRDAAAEAQIATDVVHFRDAGKSFDTDQAVLEEAWLRTLNWFDSHLR